MLYFEVMTDDGAESVRTKRKQLTKEQNKAERENDRARASYGNTST